MLRKPLYLGRVLFEEDSGKNPPAPNPDPTPNPVTPPKEEDGPKVTLTQTELDARMAAARKEGKASAEKLAADAKTAADADAERKRQEAAGEYETAKAGLEKERDGFKTDLDTANTQITAYAEIVAKQVEALKGDLPAELLGDYPNDGTPLDQLVWLEGRKQVFEVAKTAAGATATNITRLPATPKGRNRNATDAAYEQMKGRVSI